MVDDSSEHETAKHVNKNFVAKKQAIVNTKMFC